MRTGSSPLPPLPRSPIPEQALRLWRRPRPTWTTSLPTMTHQTIGADKINMLRHVLFLQDLPHVKEHMAKHAALLRPKFELVLRMFEEQLREPGVAQWTNPRGGYFITCQVPEGCAKKVVQLCAEAGVILTDAGATHPYKKDPQDSAIRIAPSYPPIGELEEAMKVFCLWCAAGSGGEAAGLLIPVRETARSNPSGAMRSPGDFLQG